MAIIPLLNLLGWWFLPDRLTALALPFIHSHLRSRGYAPPAPGSRSYITQLRHLYASIILLYLVYTLTSSILSTQPNFYQLLGVGKDANETELKMAFRAFAKKYHPDRVGERGTELFVAVRDAFDALKDPVKRFGYDRFGPRALQWSKSSTISEMIFEGFQAQIGFYIGTCAILVLSSFLVDGDKATFWRYFLLVPLLSTELTLILLPSSPSSYPFPLSLLATLSPDRATYQNVEFARQVYIAAATALTRVLPILMAEYGSEDANITSENLKGALGQLAQMSRAVDEQASLVLTGKARALQLLQTPQGVDSSTSSPGGVLSPPKLEVDEENMSLIAPCLESLAVETALANHPEVRVVVESELSQIRASRDRNRGRAR